VDVNFLNNLFLWKGSVKLTKKLADFLPQIFMILLGLWLLYIIPVQISNIPGEAIGPRFFPNTLATALIVLSLISLASTYIKIKKNKQIESDLVSKQEKDEREPLKTKGYKKVISIFISLIVWALLVPIIGFGVMTFLLMMLSMAVIGSNKISKIIIVSASFTLILYTVAKYLLRVSIHSGILF
jgi:putative tricarboxylic transport membrane protein